MAEIETPVAEPSVGSESPNVAEPSPGSVDYGKMDDLELLSDDSTSETKPPAEAAKPEATETKEAKPATEQAKPETEQDEDPLAPVEVSEKLKTHFADKEVGKELRDSYFRDKAFREVYPTVAEAREMRNLFPTLDDAKVALEGQASFNELGNLYNSADPQFLLKLHEENPESFKGLAAQFGKIHHQLDPEGYFKDSETRFSHALKALRQEAQDEGDDNRINAVDVIYEKLFGRFPEQDRGRADPRDAEIRQLREKLDTRQKTEKDQSFKSFFSSVDATATEKIQAEVKTAVEKFLNGSAVTDGAKAEITSKVYSEVRQQLKSNPQLKLTLQAAIDSGDLSSKHVENVVSIIGNRANLLIAQAAKKVIPDYTRSVLGIQEQRVAKQQAAAGRVDIASGGPASEKVSALPAKGDPAFYKKFDDNAILDM
jgi:hypothetical protein